MACFPRRWKTAIIIAIIKPGKETSNDIAKYRPISLISTLAKVLENVLINRIVHYMHSHNLLSQNQYGFTPQTSTVDAVMDLKDYAQRSIEEGQYVALISLDVKGAFDAAWWPGILFSIRTLKCPRNLYNLCGSYFNGRSAALILNSRKEQRTISKGCPQGSASGPGFWTIQFNSILQLEFKKNTKIIAYADDLLLLLTKGKTKEEVENYANIELSKITTWARDNKMKFNEEKSKLMIITRRRPKIKREYKIYINNTPTQQEETIKYQGIIIDKRLNFNAHIDYTTGKCMKLIHALSKSAKVNWGLRHDVLRMIYLGAILPILSYGAQVWVDGLQRNSNASKLRRIQRLTNIKIAKAYRTTSHKALCMLTGITPVLIELENTAKLYHITRGKNQYGLYDAPLNYRRWPHPAKAIELKNKRDDMHYKLEIYTDGSKCEKGVGSGVAIFVDGSLTHQLRYKLAEKCSNNQAEQLAIIKALTELRSMHTIQGSQWTTVIHADSRITLEAIANPRNHQSLVESIREELRALEEDGWLVHFTWVKAHANNLGNEIADHLAKKAACDNNLQTTYYKYPKSAVTSELKCLGLQKWQSEWDNTHKGAITKTFFPTIQDRLNKQLQMNLNLLTVVTGHGKLRSYLYRFKIIDDPTCPCQMGSQSIEHLIRECTILNKQRDSLKKGITNAGGRWSLSNSELANKYTNLFLKFVNSINFEGL
jgi:ribonuclease HI